MESGTLTHYIVVVMGNPLGRRLSEPKIFVLSKVPVIKDNFQHKIRVLT